MSVMLVKGSNRPAVCFVSESRDRGSVTSLSSEFSLITEEAGGASSLTNDTVDMFYSQPQASSWSVSHTGSQSQGFISLLYHCLGEHSVLIGLKVWINLDTAAPLLF